MFATLVMFRVQHYQNFLKLRKIYLLCDDRIHDQADDRHVQRDDDAHHHLERGQLALDCAQLGLDLVETVIIVRDGFRRCARLFFRRAGRLERVIYLDDHCAHDSPFKVCAV